MQFKKIDVCTAKVEEIKSPVPTVDDIKYETYNNSRVISLERDVPINLSLSLLNKSLKENSFFPFNNNSQGTKS